MADDTTAAVDGSAHGGPPVRGFRDAWWFRLGGAVVLVLVVALVWTRVAHRDVVAEWKLLATCPSTVQTAPTPVVTALDTAACTSPPLDPQAGRGWPIVAFVLPVDVGLDPSIAKVHSDKSGHRMWLDYAPAAPGDGRGGDDIVLAFIEVPPSDLPDVPFTVDGATGPVPVTEVPAG